VKNNRTILTHLEGYNKSTPVRVGNNAYNQLQLDIYGELMDAVYMLNKFGRPVAFDTWKKLTECVDWVCSNWNRADDCT